MPADPKELRKVTRQVEEAHDDIEDQLAVLQAEHEKLMEQRRPIDESIRQNEAKMDELKSSVHGLRLMLAEMKRGDE